MRTNAGETMVGGAQLVGTWRPIEEFVEPDGDKAADGPPVLFWRKNKGAVLGFIRDGELFDARSVYVCDANKATHFAEIVAPPA